MTDISKLGFIPYYRQKVTSNLAREIQKVRNILQVQLNILEEYILEIRETYITLKSSEFGFRNAAEFILKLNDYLREYNQQSKKLKVS